VTGVEAATLAKASRIDLADSALHAPAAGFGDEDFYPDIYDKAAILCCRLAWNHPLPDGNKRASWAALLLHRSQRRQLGPRPARCRPGRGGDDGRGCRRGRRGMARQLAS
jgi:Fic/DOC family